MPLSGTTPHPSGPVPAGQPQVSAGVPLATTVRRFRQRRRQLSSESNLVSQTGSASTAPAAIQSGSTTTTGSSSAAGAPDLEGGRAYSDPTEMMEKRKRCNERAERMRKAYRRLLPDEFRS